MIYKKLMTKTFLLGPFLGAILFVAIVAGCTGDAEHTDGRDSDRATESQGMAEKEGDDSGGEHSSRGEGSGEHGSGGDGSSTGADGGGENNEAAMSSPITPLGQSWRGVLGGLAVSMQYDAATRSVSGTVRNTLSQTICYVQAEPHLKSGTKTVGELGPDVLGHLSPGQEATTSLTVASEPELAGVSYDGYVVHMEVFDCTALALRRTKEERALKAAVNTVLVAKKAMNPLELAAKKATTQMPSPWMRPMMKSAAAPG